MNDLVRQAQGEFIAGAADYTSMVLQSTGDAMTTSGYVMMASGVGAQIGAPMAKVGNLVKNAGTAIEIGIDWIQGNRARAGYNTAAFFVMKGLGKFGNRLSTQEKAIYNLILTPYDWILGYGAGTIPNNK